MVNTRRTSGKPPVISIVARKFLEKLEAESAKSTIKQDFIDRCYQTGAGKAFVEACRQYGCTEAGEPLKITPWYAEYLELLSTQSVAERYCSGASQTGKTLGCTLLMAYLLTEGRVNLLWAYDKEASLNIQVPSNFKPVIREWLKRKGVKTSREDAQSNTLYQLQGATVQFTYTSTSKTSTTDGTAAAGGVNVGVSRDLLVVEERSQHLPGSIDPLKRRLDAGRLPTRPIIEVGTKGSGLGIESSIAKAQYDFHPHYTCHRCGFTGALLAKGCLLKPHKRTVNGKTTQAYLSESGRPVEWHHHSDTDAVETAYFGCAQCGEEIPDGDRLNAWFQCIKTGVTLRSFLDSIPPGVPSRQYTTAITLSPLLRVEKTNIAAAIIREGLVTRNPVDWSQQRLAEVPESSFNSIPLDHLIQAIGKATPERKPDYILAGMDQGRADDWLVIVNYWLPDDHKKLSTAEIMDQTIRSIVWGGGTTRPQVPDLLKEYGAVFGLTDNEPDRPDLAKLCAATCLEMADQRSGVPYDVKSSIVLSGGVEYTAWLIRHEDFLKQVLNGFLLTAEDGEFLYRLPASWDKWISQGTERSPLVHLTTPSYNPESGKWIRQKGVPDHIYYALMFCEAAFYLKITNADNEMEKKGHQAADRISALLG